MVARTFFSILIFSVIAAAQFTSLATNAEGSVVYFATTLRQKNTDQPNHGKLFRFDTALALQESRPEIPPEGYTPGVITPGRFGISNAYNFQRVTVSSDGKTVAAAASRYCLGDGVFCFKGNDLVLTTVTSNGQSRTFDGDLRLSANGVWAVGSTTIPEQNSPFRIYLADLAAGSFTRIEPPSRFETVRFASSGRPVANDGTIVYASEETVVILRVGRYRRIPITANGGLSDAVIDSAAKFILFVRTEFIFDEERQESSLYIAPVENGEPRLLAAAAYAPSISDDGSKIMFLAPDNGVTQAWTISPDGTGMQRVTNEPTGISAATIAGNGKVAFAVTRANRVIRIDIDTGTSTELISRTPWVAPLQSAAVDRYSRFNGGGFSADDRTQATINGRQTVVAAVWKDAIDLLVAPDVPIPAGFNARSTLELSASPNSPFDGPRVEMELSDYLPSFLYNGENSNSPVTAVHQDWRSLVSSENPARPGETVHLYAVGLGATTPPVPFGQPAPTAEPLARLASQFVCSGDSYEPVRTRYEGLAPGLTGIYQMDVEIPVISEPRTFTIICKVPGAGQFREIYGRLAVRP